MQFFRAAIFVLLFAIPCFAQHSGISGHILDESGAPLPGVAVQVTDASGNGSKIVYSDGEGHFAVGDLQPGTYRMSFRLLNFTTVVKEGVVTKPGEATRIDVILPLSVSAEVVVTGKRTFRNLADLDGSIDSLIGIADAASQGTVTGEQLDSRPIMRPGEILETVPGVIVSQHSGEGKANQYYLRGFNLDHGTDFATWIAGMPVNFPSHGHGQGYTDVSFLIPELVSGVQYKKGPYYADEGDFASAGAVDINYTNSLDDQLVKIDGGSYSFGRALVAGSPFVANGNLLYALELSHNDGAWDLPQNYRKINGLVRYTHGDVQSGFSLTGMFYRGDWDSTDQIPQRAVDNGVIGRLGTIDQTDGGESHRYSLSMQWQRTWENNSLSQAAAYFLDYKLNLFSNFTYFLDDPVNGDQFEQADDRNVYGFHANHRWLSSFGRFDAENMIGVQFRNDDINGVGLYRTRARQRLAITREDEIMQRSIGLFAQNSMQWTPKFRSVLGLRGDFYSFDVQSNVSENSGNESDALLSPKLTLIFGPWKQTEYYFNIGYGFHSNDARGSTITIDPSSGEPAQKVDPLVRARGYEFGIRTAAWKRYQSTFALWRLDIDSELLFVGDAGITEASRPSTRYGFEWSNYYRPLSWLILDADIAISHSRFSDFDPAGDRIPGAIESVFSAGAAYEGHSPWSGGIRVRYFGPRPLIEDNSVRSDSSTLVNARIGYRLTKNWQANVEVYNLLNSKASDIDYFYTSRLIGEPFDGVNDVHSHPLEPTAFRFNLQFKY